MLLLLAAAKIVDTAISHSKQLNGYILVIIFARKWHNTALTVTFCAELSLKFGHFCRY